MSNQEEKKRSAWPYAALTPAESDLEDLAAQSGVNIGACYACKKCSNGCPLSYAMDLMPHQVVRLVQMGQLETVKKSNTPWLCASCHTCVTRCPNKVDLPRFMDWLKQTLHEDNASIEQQNTLLFHRSFLKEVIKRGRVFEAGLMTRYMIGSGDAFGPGAFENAKLGWDMLKRGRLEFLPSGIKDRGFLKRLFKEEV